jgi:hypothetical protein
MTPQEFKGPFDLLCRGLECQPTQEQVSAWFRRIGHIAMLVWKNTVDDLLFDGRKGYLPRLEHVLEVVEKEAEYVRKAMVERDKFQAKKTYTLLQSPVNPEEQSRIPSPGTPLFACIQAFSGRADAQRRLARVATVEKWDDEQKQRETQRLQAAVLVFTQTIDQYSPLLHDEDAAKLVTRYETPVMA